MFDAYLDALWKPFRCFHYRACQFLELVCLPKETDVGESLREWIKEAEESEVNELRRFAAGL